MDSKPAADLAQADPTTLDGKEAKSVKALRMAALKEELEAKKKAAIEAKEKAAVEGNALSKAGAAGDSTGKGAQESADASADDEAAAALSYADAAAYEDQVKRAASIAQYYEEGGVATRLQEAKVDELAARVGAAASFGYEKLKRGSSIMANEAERIKDKKRRTARAFEDAEAARKKAKSRVQYDAARIVERAKRELDDPRLKSAPGDSNELCGSWAFNGECMRNPQYMFSACANSCDAQVYVDTEAECESWTTLGECEKNPDFMLERCNMSCITEAKRILYQPRSVRRNPHLDAADDDDETGVARLRTFAPVFLAMLVALGLALALSMRFADVISEKQLAVEEAYARLVLRAQRTSPALAVVLNAMSANAIGRAFICLYFFNESFTVLQTNPKLAFLLSPFLSVDGVWQEHQLWLDASNLAGGVAACLCLCGVLPVVSACVMLADIAVDSYIIIARIFWTFIFGHGLYINELMAKKFSLMGCVGMLIAVIVQNRQRRASFPGLLMEASSLSTSLSVALLLGRLMIAVLFLYVGLSELHRLLFQPYTPYLPGDGHDVVWPKAVELLLAIPFTLGFRTTAVSRLLATSLVLEAFYAWSWWSLAGDAGAFSQHRRVIHYREHFMTNVATAGGLLLLQKLGGGKYTVDELLKKKD